MNKHILWMIIGCTLPLLLIFLAPALGLSGDVSLLIFVIAMFACHLLMPMHHGGHRHKDELQDQPLNNKSKEHEPY
ncbi:hypothetical protein [Pontibacter vulgaris]|uniref:hypothetical protein n=1 Tax=Pontibacter vulgaris TaxID=2905679 RepID=UPI001FA780D6|nr:hypothetical protein [Pontibacter vulgaris]